MSKVRTARWVIGFAVAVTLGACHSAPTRIYSLDPRPLTELDAWLEPYRRTWERSLDALERHLDSTSTPTKEQ